MSPSTTTTTRWSPTPEQLMILEEMYKGGLRTPNATQIQKITSHLSFYGKIEGKNVFYWFQNHKARDRQKLRKKLILTKQLQLQQKFSQNSNIIINNYASSSDDVVLGLIDPPLPHPPPPPPHPSLAGIHLHALHHEYDRYAEYLRLQGGTDDDGGTARLTSDGGDDDWMMMMTTTKKTVSSSSMTRDINAPVGPTCTLPCCTMTYHNNNNNNNRPLKTLELFPVTSPNLIKQHQINIDGADTELSRARVIFDL